MTKSRRRWLQFRLKTIFVLVAVVAVPCWWFKGKWDRKQAERRAVVAIRELDGWVIYDWQDNGKDTPPGPAWLRAVLGDDFFAEVKHVKITLYPNFDIVQLHALKRLQTLWIWGDGSKQFTDADFTFLTEMNDLEELMLGNVHFTDAGMATIKQLHRLTKLELDGTGITDSGLEELSHVAALEELSLARSRIIGGGLVHLRALQALRELDLRETSLTDAGLEDLKKMKRLIHLCVDDTQLSPEGMAELEKALPNKLVSAYLPADTVPPEGGDPRREDQVEEGFANP